MPFSTSSAVRTPGSERPSSTSVIATAGRMPTTTVRVEHGGHRRDVAERAADEGVDHVERRDVDQHAPRARPDDALGEVVLQRDREAIVHVDLDADQHLLKTVAAARLMGAECIVSGIRPQIAQTIVHLGVELGGVVTKATLADAFGVALERAGLAVGRSTS